MKTGVSHPSDAGRLQASFCKSLSMSMEIHFLVASVLADTSAKMLSCVLVSILYTAIHTEMDIVSICIWCHAA